jgi:hypothetical protein
MDAFRPDPSDFKTIRPYVFLNSADGRNNFFRELNSYESSDGFRHIKLVIGFGLPR